MHSFIGFEELLNISINLGQTLTQVLLGIHGFKFIALLTGVRLVPALMVSYLLTLHTVTLRTAIASGLLLSSLSGVRFVFITRDPRDLFAVIISLIGLLILLLLGGRHLGLMICVHPIVLGL